MKGLLFTYALTYGGAAASLFNPWYGLLVYVCFSIIRPEALWFYSVPDGNYSRVVALAMLVGWALHGFGSWRFGRATATVGALVAYLAWTSVSAFFAIVDRTIAWGIVDNLAKIVLPFVVAMTLIKSVAQLKQLAWVLMSSTGYVALELNVAYYGGNNQARERGFAALDNNGVALVMVIATALAVFLALAERAWWRRLIAIGASMLMINCNMFCFSRGGILALIVTGFVGFIVIPKKPVHFVLFACAVGVSLRLAGPQVVERFATVGQAEDLQTAAGGRLQLWGNCLQLMGESPIVGVGPMQFPLISQRFGWEPGKQAHTLWLQVGAEQGLPGLASLLCFFGITVVRLWRDKRALENHDPWLVDVARITTASLAGFAVAAQFLSMQTVELPFYVALLGAGALKLSALPRSERAVTHQEVGWI